MFLSELERLYMVALRGDETIFELQSQTTLQADYQAVNKHIQRINGRLKITL